MQKSRLVIFIIIVLVVFLGIYTFYMLFHKPAMTLIVKFKEAPPVIQGILRGKINAYYRGYQVGRVSKVTLSKGQQYIVFYLDIYYKNLCLPENTNITLKTQDIFGDRYFDLNYPANPSSKMLTNGDVLYGTAVFERLDKYLVQELERGELNKLINNLIYLTGELNTVIRKNKLNIDDFLGQILTRGGNISQIIENLAEFIEDPEIKRQLESLLLYANRTLRNVNEIIKTEEVREAIAETPETLSRAVQNLERVNQNLPEVNENITEVQETIALTNKNVKLATETISRASLNIDQVSENIEQVNTSIEQITEEVVPLGDTLDCTNSLLYSTNYNLTGLNYKIPPIPPDLLYNANQTIKRYNCIGWALSKTLSKNFLFFRFLFGNPGSSFEDCIQSNPNCCYPEKNQNNEQNFNQFIK